MELGVFSLTDIYPGSTDTAASRIDDIVGYGILAEQSGLDVFGIGEHHTRAFAVSSPAVVHAAIARATSRITLTTTATVLSVLDPVRVYQDFATLDLVSHGRAEIIAGRSAFAEPFALFGEDIAQLDDLFAEKLDDLLLRLRNEDRVTWTGRFRPPLRGRSNPHPVGPLPIWVTVGGTPASAVRAGRLGLPMALGFIGGTHHGQPRRSPWRPDGRRAYAGRREDPRPARRARRRPGLGQVDLGGMPHQMVRDSIQRFGDIVAPRRPPRPPPRATTPARMNVTVFGATGAIGSLTVNELLANGHTVTAYARNPNKIPPEWGHRVRVIIGEPAVSQAAGKVASGLGTSGSWSAAQVGAARLRRRKTG